MPPRRRTAAGLSEQDVAALEAALAAGKQSTVYLRDAVPSLGLTEGASAKVVRFADGNIVVRPRGVDDELPFELDEVRLTRQAAAAPERSASAQPRTAPAQSRTAATPKPQPAPAPQPAAEPSQPPVAEATPAPARPKRPGKKLAEGVLVTIHGGTDNVWTVGVSYGPRPSGKSNAVQPDAVEKAVAALNDEAAIAAVDSVLTAARAAVTNRIEDLNRQLAEARAALAALGSAD